MTDLRSLAHQPRPAKPEAWKDRAACVDADPDLFFPARGVACGSVDITAAAKAICRGCPVIADCLDYAQTAPVERFGVWGGLSRRERRDLAKRRPRPLTGQAVAS